MAEFITSPFALVTFGLIVLAVAIVLLVAWIVTLDRRMRGVVDGLETERRKVAEMQMVIGRRTSPRGYAAPRPQRPVDASRPQRPIPADAAAAGRASQPSSQQHDARSEIASDARRADAPRASRGSAAASDSRAAEQGRAVRGHARSRREGPSIPRGVDRTQQVPRSAAARPAVDARRSADDARAAQGFTGSTPSPAASRPTGVHAAPARRADDASVHAVSAVDAAQAAAEEARRAAERAARQKRMAERRMQAAKAQPDAATDAAAPRASAARAAAPDAAAHASRAARQAATAVAPANRATSVSRPERTGAPMHARHAR